MISPTLPYIPVDRLRNYQQKQSFDVPESTNGSVLFADISGFTAATELMHDLYGARRGAEILVVHLNRVYNALIDAVQVYGGVVINFSGDAIMCIFSGTLENTALDAVSCAITQMASFTDVSHIAIEGQSPLELGLKISVASGKIQRYLVGDPTIQRIDTLAGSTVARMAMGEGLANRGDIILDDITLQHVPSATIREWRTDADTRFAVLDTATVIQPDHATDAFELEPDFATGAEWVLPAIADYQAQGYDDFLTELRPTAALFVRFLGIDYDHDADAKHKLDTFVQRVQRIVYQYDGSLLQLTIGDKGSYAYAAFGAPIAHENDYERAINAAQNIRDVATKLDFISQVQLGITRGIMRTGAYGSNTRKTYGVLGDNVNLAARLMMLAEPNTILMSEPPQRNFVVESLDKVKVKGKAEPIPVYRFVRRAEAVADRFYDVPMVGRSSEQEQFYVWLQSMLSGNSGGVIYLNGEAGMGKSRLAHSIEQAFANDFEWVTAQTDEILRLPLQPFRYALRGYFRQRNDASSDANQAAFEQQWQLFIAQLDDEVQHQLRDVESYLAGLIGITIAGSSYAQAEDRTRLEITLYALRLFFRAMASVAPLVLHIEDAHWLDEASITAIQRMTVDMADTPMSIVLTSRYYDDGSRYEIPKLGAVDVHTLDLAPLSDGAMRELCEYHLGGGIREDLLNFVAAKSQGNPFFVEQITLDMRERGLLTQNGSWSLGDGAVDEIPNSINGVLIARIDRLTADLKVAVQTASVLGREFDVRVLSQMLQGDADEKVEAGAAKSIWSALDDLRYLYRHALLRDAAYNMQVQSRLQQLHQSAAESIEALYPNDTSQMDALLEHWHQAGNVDKEYEYVVPVANRFVQYQSDYQRALDLVERTLETIPEGDARRAALYNVIASAYGRLGKLIEAEQVGRDALALARLAKDARAQVTALRAIADSLKQRGEVTTALPLAEEAVSIAKTIGDKALFANVINNYSATLRQSGNFDNAETYALQALELCEELDLIAGLANTLSGLAIIYNKSARIDESKQALRRAIDLFIEVGDRSGLAKAYQSYAITFARHGDYETAGEYFQKTLDITLSLGEQSAIANSYVNLGIVHSYFRRFDQAEYNYKQALAIHERTGHTLGIATVHASLAVTAARQEKFNDALRYLDVCLNIHRKQEMYHGLPNNLNNKASMLISLKRYDEAEAVLREAIPLAREHQILNSLANSYNSLAGLYVDTQRFDEMMTAAYQAFDVYKDINNTSVSLQALIYVVYAMSYRGDFEKATHFAHYIAHHPRLHNDSKSRLERAQAHIDANRPEDMLINIPDDILERSLESMVQAGIQILEDYLDEVEND